MVDVDFEELAARIAAGEALSSTDLRELAQSRDLIGLGMLATDVRARLHGMRGTFVRVAVVEVTGQLAGGTGVGLEFPTPQADGTLVGGGTFSAGEVRLAGAPAALDVARALVSAATPLGVPVSGWSLEELEALGPLGDVLPALREAGLHAVAAARLDRLTLAQLQALAVAGVPLQTVTLGTPLDGDALLDALEQLRAWQAATGIVRACAPLPVETPVDAPTTGFDDMRHVALARLVLDNIPHIQAHWTRMGPKLSQSCLLFGANDIDAVPARDEMPHGPRRAILEEVRRNLLAASLEVVERDGAWQPRGDA